MGTALAGGRSGRWRRRVVGPVDLERWRVGHPGLRRGHGADVRLPGQAHLRVDRGADGDHEPRRRPLREGTRHRRARRGRGRAAGVGPRDRARAGPRATRASSGSAGPRCSPATPTRRRPPAVIAPGGWFRTGDLATVDAEGWLRIVGRLKDVIIRGGENISASEVEAALEAHPDVRHAVAVGYPDPLMGERVAAFVESSAPFDLEECRRWFSSRGMAVSRRPSGWSASTSSRCSVRARPTGRPCGGGRRAAG